MRIRLFLAAALVSGLPAAAFAYLPPSKFIVERLAFSRAKTRPVKVTSTVRAMDGSDPTGPVLREIAVFIPDRGILRSGTFDDSGGLLYYVERVFDRPKDPLASEEAAAGAIEYSPELKARFGLGAPTGSAASESSRPAAQAAKTEPPAGEPAALKVPAADALLFETVPYALVTSLAAWSIPVKSEAELRALPSETDRRKAERTYLRRWEGRHAWVIGDPDPSRTEPQLWVEKDSFLPIRLILPAGSAGVPTELRFSSFRFTSGFRFPGRIDVQEDENAVLRAEVERLDIVTKMTELKREAPDGYTERGKSASSSVQELIDRYYRVLR